MLVEVLRVTSIEISARISALEEELSRLPIGNLVMKKIKGKEQPYLQWSEAGKTKSRYIKMDEREITMKQLFYIIQIGTIRLLLSKALNLSAMQRTAPVPS